MMELHAKKLCTLVAVPNGLLIGNQLPCPFTPAQLDQIEAMADGLLAGAVVPDHVVEPRTMSDPPEHCENCGRAEPLQDFRGWRHDGDECDWLCGDCYSTATMEE